MKINIEIFEITGNDICDERRPWAAVKLLAALSTLLRSQKSITLSFNVKNVTQLLPHAHRLFLSPKAINENINNHHTEPMPTFGRDLIHFAGESGRNRRNEYLSHTKSEISLASKNFPLVVMAII